MSGRQGELTPDRIDREFPHQIIVPADWYRSDDVHRMHCFCIGLSLAPRTRSVVEDGRWHIVFCFAVRGDADRFRARFGGAWFDPAARGRGRRSYLLREAKRRTY